jgi:hydroxyacylglutathione hydrolase
MWANMQTYAAMPPGTKVYGGHEYTQANARFAAHVDPDNAAVSDRRVVIDRLRAAGKPTLPTTIGEERDTNPFMRAGSAERLGELRARKDDFRG